VFELRAGMSPPGLTGPDYSRAAGSLLIPRHAPSRLGELSG